MSYNLPKSFEILPPSDEIDLTIPGLYDLFTISNQFIPLCLFAVNTAFSGSVSSYPLGTAGWTGPAFDDFYQPSTFSIAMPIANGVFQISQANGIVPISIPSGTFVKLNLTQAASIAGSWKAKYHVMGYYN